MFNISVIKINLLTLHGVKEKDLIADTLPPKSDDLAIEGDDLFNMYSDIPQIFTSVKTWPAKTNLKCWNCSQIPKNYPKFIPTNLKYDIGGNITCDVHGNFDTWNCAIKYLKHNFHQKDQWDLVRGVSIVESLFTGAPERKIVEAPPHTLMREYCGNKGLTLAQYNVKLEECNNN